MFVGEEALKTATGSVYATASGNYLEVSVNVGWAEARTPQAAIVKPSLRGTERTYTVSLLSVRIGSKEVPVGTSGVVDYAIDDATLKIDGYRTLYCGYQEGGLLDRDMEPTRCNRDVER